MKVLKEQDLNIIITGGARGIGRAAAALLVNGGAHVLIADVLDEEGEALADSLGPNALYQRLDVRDIDNWQAAIASAEAEFGSLNALFNNAGILGLGGVAECSPEEFGRIIEVNLNGVFLGINSVVPALQRAGGGVIVNTSSTAGLQGYAGLAAYVSSKWGGARPHQGGSTGFGAAKYQGAVATSRSHPHTHDGGDA